MDLKSRKLIYEGELEWKVNVTMKHLALLFEDILVFLETSNDDSNKRRYVLKPLSYVLNRSRQTFTPVIPLACINSFRPMRSEKRNFHLVVIIEDHTKASSRSNKLSLQQHHSTPQLQSQLSASGLLSQAKSIQSQMLFILTAKSGDERNKWTHYLQALTGKMTEAENNAIDLAAPPPSAAASAMATTATTASSIAASVSTATSLSGASTTTTISAAMSTLNSIQIAPLNVNLNSETTNAARDNNNSKSHVNSSEYMQLEAQLRDNTNSIHEMLKARQSILEKMLKFNSGILDMEDFNEVIQHKKIN